VKIHYNVNLKPYNTMRLNSIAKEFYIPESIDEFVSLVKKFKENSIEYYLLSVGSNIIFGEFVSRPVIFLLEMDNTLNVTPDGLIECGGSVRIQKLIRFMQKKSFGGIEYLFSVPSSVGGAVFMNAGRGRKHNKSISDYIYKVQILDNDTIKTIDVDKSMFSYRNSIFQKNNLVVLKAYFLFPKQDPKLTRSIIRQRLEHSRQFLNSEKPSCGSIFSKGNPILYRLIRGYTFGGAMFSKKTPNWISNVNNAKSEDILKLIHFAKKLHKYCFQKYRIEVKIYL